MDLFGNDWSTAIWGLYSDFSVHLVWGRCAVKSAPSLCRLFLTVGGGVGELKNKSSLTTEPGNAAQWAVKAVEMSGAVGVTENTVTVVAVTPSVVSEGKTERPTGSGEAGASQRPRRIHSDQSG